MQPPLNENICIIATNDRWNGDYSLKGLCLSERSFVGSYDVRTQSQENMVTIVFVFSDNTITQVGYWPVKQ